MDKRYFTNNEVVRILVRLLLDEYQIIKKIKSVSGMIDLLNYKKGEEIKSLKGFIIAPSVLEKEGFTNKKVEYMPMDEVNKLGLENYFRDIIPDEKATIIGKKGIAHNVLLDTEKDAVKVVKNIFNNPDFTIDNIVEMYYSEDIGTRLTAAITAHVLLIHQGILKELYIENPERFEDVDGGFILDKEKLDKETSYKGMQRTYNGEVICKVQKASNNSTLTGSIMMFSPKDNIGESAEFNLIPFSECKEEIKEKYSRRKRVKYGFKFIIVPKKEYVFDEEDNRSDPIVGLLRLYKYDDKVCVDKEYLIEPSEIGVRPYVSYSNIEKAGIFVKEFVKKFVPKEN